jgi:hypothetical protein
VSVTSREPVGRDNERCRPPLPHTASAREPPQSTTVVRNRGRDDAFHSFFESHYADLARLAYLVTGEPEVADDLAADALLEVWRHWDRVAAADSPIAYTRGVLANLARNRIRRLRRERRGLLGVSLLWRARSSMYVRHFAGCRTGVGHAWCCGTRSTCPSRRRRVRSASPLAP